MLSSGDFMINSQPKQCYHSKAAPDKWPRAPCGHKHIMPHNQDKSRSLSTLQDLLHRANIIGESFHLSWKSGKVFLQWIWSYQKCPNLASDRSPSPSQRARGLPGSPVMLQQGLSWNVHFTVPAHLASEQIMEDVFSWANRTPLSSLGFWWRWLRVWRDVIWELPPLAAALASNPLLLRDDWRFFFLLFFLANITGLLFANFLWLDCRCLLGLLRRAILLLIFIVFCSAAFLLRSLLLLSRLLLGAIGCNSNVINDFLKGGGI